MLPNSTLSESIVEAPLTHLAKLYLEYFREYYLRMVSTRYEVLHILVSECLTRFYYESFKL